ncbi:MAG: hypothetical protein ACRDXB_15510, partial [Actinomycetes bacterium]
MSGVYGYPQPGPPRSVVAVPRMIAAALLVAAALSTVGGSFAAFSVYRFESDYTPASTTTTTGWGAFEDPVPEEPTTSANFLHGIPLTIAAVLALVAAVVILRSARQPGDGASGRLLGTSAVGLLVGVVAVIWLELLTLVRNVAAVAAEAAPDIGIRTSFEIGLGGHLILVGGLAGLAAAALLLV